MIYKTIFITIILLLCYTQQVHAQTWPTIDPVTREYYDMVITTSPRTQQRTGAGPVYVMNTTFKIYGERVNSFSSLYGYLQTPYTGIEPVYFSLSNTTISGAPVFESNPVALVDNECIDFHWAAIRAQYTYIATVCVSGGSIAPGSSAIMYGPNSYPAVGYTYNGGQTTSMQILSLPFNKYEQPDTFDGINAYGSRVGYVVIDSSQSGLSDFSPTTYYLRALQFGLSTQLEAQICQYGANYPKKYRKQTSSPIPQGGNNDPVTDQVGYCQFAQTQNSLSPFFISLDIEGGIPLPASGVTPEPTPTFAPVSPGVRGDATGDGRVSIDDLAVLLSVFGTAHQAADFNKNGVVDISDLAVLLAQFGS